MIKVLILVLSYNDNGGVYSKFYNTQKQTWDSEIIDNIETYYYFGNHHTNTIIDKNIFTIDTEDYKCTRKTLTTFDLIKNLDFDFLVRTNSSSYIDKKLLYNFLKEKPKNKYYGGITGEYNGFKFASGACFVMSKDVLNLVIQNYDKVDFNLIDDVAIAKLLKELNIYPKNEGFRRFDFPFNDINNPNFINFFHYRLYTNKEQRTNDINMMKKIFNLKNEYNNR